MRIQKNNKTVLVHIYGLFDPVDENNIIRYIGITTNKLNNRLSGHLYDAKKCKNNNRRANWINKLVKEGRKPSIVLLETIIGYQNACNREIELIADYKEKGFDLINATIGGEGIIGYKITEEHRRKLSESHKGYIMTEEAKEKLRVFNTGKTMSESAKEKMRAKVVSEETRKKMSKAQKGLKRSQETKNKISKSKSGVNHPLYGIPRTDEMKLKQSIAMKATLKKKKEELSIKK